VTAADLRVATAALARTFEAERDALGALDAEVGDGDHGAGMARGFRAAAEAAAATAGDDVGVVLVAVGRGLMRGVGGASGALFATIFLEQGKAAAGATAWTSAQAAAGAAAARAAIQALGRSGPGDKTMIDALQPASEALSARAEAPLAEALAGAAAAARAGAEATRALAARHGRARYVADGGVGHVDPGAVSVALTFETLAAAAGGREAP